eukprot:scaffold237419_cov26-Tisochrysis_lutea.AAC.1
MPCTVVRHSSSAAAVTSGFHISRACMRVYVCTITWGGKWKCTVLCLSSRAATVTSEFDSSRT